LHDLAVNCHQVVDRHLRPDGGVCNGWGHLLETLHGVFFVLEERPALPARVEVIHPQRRINTARDTVGGFLQLPVHLAVARWDEALDQSEHVLLLAPESRCQLESANVAVIAADWRSVAWKHIRSNRAALVPTGGFAVRAEVFAFVNG